MPFSAEVIKALRRRSVFLEFSSTHNPGKTWTGDATKLYGRFQDERGAIPVKPTVQSLGIVNRSLANFERPIEIPSNSVSLIDEGNEWRAQGDPANDTLTDYWLRYVLRVADDAGAIYDQKIASAQIVTAKFPPRKGVRLDCAQMVGQALARKKPGRTVNLADFPRADPVSLNEAVQYIYGVNSNLVATQGYTPAVSGAVAASASGGTLLYEQDWSAGASVFGSPRTTPGGNDDYYQSVGSVGDPDLESVDPLYPDMAAAEAVNVFTGQGPAGENVLDFSETGSNPQEDYQTAGVWLHIPSVAHPGGHAHTQWGDGVTATSRVVCIQSDYKANATSLADVTYAPLFYINAGGAGYGGVNLSLSFYSGDWHLELYALPNQGNLFDDSYVVTGLQDVWKRYKLVIGVSSAQGVSDGYLQVYDDNTLAYDFQNLLIDRSALPGLDNATMTQYTAPNYIICDAYIGFAGLIGEHTNFEIWDGGCGVMSQGVSGTVITNACAQVPGISPGVNLLGGAIRCLLVDMGGVLNANNFSQAVQPSQLCATSPSGTAPSGVTAYQASPGICPGSTVIYAYVAGIDSNGDIGPLSPQVATVAQANDYELHVCFNEGTYTSYASYICWISTDASFDPLNNAVACRYKVIANSPNNGVYPPSSPRTRRVVFQNDTDGAVWPGCKTAFTTHQLAPITGLTARVIGGDTSTARRYCVSIRDVCGETPAVCIDVNGPATPSDTQRVELDWNGFPEEQQVRAARIAAGLQVNPYHVYGNTPSNMQHMDAGGSARRNTTRGYDDDGDDQPRFGLTPPVTNTTCLYQDQTNPSGTTTGAIRYRYLVAGHTCKRILDVYVLKPDPTNPNTSSPVWLRQTLGVDYDEEIVEINGNRYHLLAFPVAQQSAACEWYPVTANVEGITDDGTINGRLLENAGEVLEHMLLNWIFNTYRSSIGPFAPPGGTPWFTDVVDAPGAIDRNAFWQLMLQCAPSGLNYIAAGCQSTQLDGRQIIQDYISTYLMDFYFDNNVNLNGAWGASIFIPANVVRASVPTCAYANDDIIEGTFEWEQDRSKIINFLQYFGGPLVNARSQTRGSSSAFVVEAGGYLISGEMRDGPSRNRYGERVGKLYGLWTRDMTTLGHVAGRVLALYRNPFIRAFCRGSIKYVLNAAGGTLKVTHPDGSGAAGFSDRIFQIHRADIDLDRPAIGLELRDVDHLVP